MRLPALAMLLIAVLAPMLALSAEERTLRYDGRDRRYVVEFPDAEGPRPAIVVFHGAGGTAERVRRATDFSLDKQGWVEVYPDAIGRVWSDKRSLLTVGAFRVGDDLGFVRALLRELEAEGRVDADRVFFTGLSNGGAMTLLMVCQAPELVAGAAVHIMALPVGLDCPPGPPVPMMFMLGTNDPLVPFGGGWIRWGGQDRFGVRSAAQTLAFFAKRNRCGRATERLLADRDPDDGTRVRLVDYRGCAAPLVAFVIEGGGHSWAGSNLALFSRLFGGSGPDFLPKQEAQDLLRRVTGSTTRDVSATAETEGFFRRIAGER